MLITNANIKTMEKGDIPNGYLLIQDGVFQKIGSMETLAGIQDAQTLNLNGAMVVPGLIDAHCHIGLWEDGLGFEGADGNEETDPITPHMRAIDGINPADYCFQEAIQAGITTVVTGPGSANPISGSWCAMKTHGRRMDDMLLRAEVGMKFALGENPKTVYHAKGEMPSTRMGTVGLIREALYKAKRYLENLQAAKKDNEMDPPEYDVKCEALLPVLQRQSKALFHAHRADDIFTAIRIANEFSLDYVIIHGTECYKIADILAQESASVIAGPVLCDRSKPELRDMSLQNVPTLHKAGITTALCTDHPEIPIQYLALSMGLCIKAGLPYDEALRLLTIVPAEICGIADRVGSIAAGKDADLLVFSQDIFGVYTSPDYVISNGDILVEPNTPSRISVSGFGKGHQA